MTFHIKLCLVQNRCVLDLIKWIDLLEFMGPEKYDAIYNSIRYHISQKVALHMVFLIIMQKSKLIHMILYL